MGNLGIALENVNATHADPEIIVNSAVVDLYFNNGRITNTKITKHLSDNTTEISNINGLNIPTDALTPAYIKSLVSDNVAITVNLTDSDKNSKEDLSFKQGLITNLTNAGINFGTIDAVGNDDVVIINSATVDLSFNNGIITNTKITKHLSNNTTETSNSASLNKDIDALTAADIKSIVSDNVAITVNVRDADPSSTEDLSFKQGLITNLTNAGITIGTIDALPDTNLTINPDYTIETHNPADFNGMDVTISFDPSVEKFDINKLVEYKNNLTAAGANVSFDLPDVNEVSIDLTDESNITYMNELYDNYRTKDINDYSEGNGFDTNIIDGLLSVKSHVISYDGVNKHIRQAFVINGDNRHLSVNTTNYDIGASYNGGIIINGQGSRVEFSDGVNFISSKNTSIDQIKPISNLIFGDISTEEKRSSYNKTLPGFDLNLSGGFSDDKNLYGTGIDYIVTLYNEKGQSSKFDFSTTSAFDFDAEAFLGNNTMYTENGEYNQGSAYKMHIDMLRYVEGEIKDVEVSGNLSNPQNGIPNEYVREIRNVYFSSDDMQYISLGNYSAAGVVHSKVAPKELPGGSYAYIIIDSIAPNTTSVNVNDTYAFNISKITESTDLAKLKGQSVNIKELYAADINAIKKLSSLVLNSATDRIIYIDNASKYVHSDCPNISNNLQSKNPSNAYINTTREAWEENARNGRGTLPAVNGTLPPALTN